VLDDTAAKAWLAMFKELLQRVDRDLDRLVFTLRPTALEDYSLGEDLSAHVQTSTELTGMPVDLELHGLEHERMAPAVESAVFCVVQETLSNVAKYARASRVSTC
jgi:signal transduction histidine kinase